MESGDQQLCREVVALLQQQGVSSLLAAPATERRSVAREVGAAGIVLQMRCDGGAQVVSCLRIRGLWSTLDARSAMVDVTWWVEGAEQSPDLCCSQ
jgi:hypothetical protein